MMNNENDIIKCLQNGDTDALRHLMELHQDYVFTIAYRIVKNREKAEEVTQDVFVKVYRNINAYQGRGKFRTWLYTIVYRTALNALNKKYPGKNENFEEINPCSPINMDSQAHVFTVNNNFDTSRILWQAIDKLPMMQGLAISLFYLNQFNIDEISEILKIPANTVKTHLHRGRKNLKYILLTKYSEEELI